MARCQLDCSRERCLILLVVIIGTSCFDVGAFLQPTRSIGRTSSNSVFPCQKVSPSKQFLSRGGRTTILRPDPSSGLPRTIQTSKSALHTVNAFAIIDQVFQSSPYATAAITCGIKASSADWIAQKRQYRLRRSKGADAVGDNTTSIANGAELIAPASSTPPAAVKSRSGGKTDIQRNIAFLLYGSLYQGVAQEFIYNHLYPLYFGTGTDLRVVLVKVAFDLLVQTTLVTLPIAYLTKAIIYKYSFREAMQRYLDDVRNHGLLIKYFSLWGPVQCITFSIIPEHYRIAFIAFVSFFWLIILSTISSRIPKIKAIQPKVEADSCDLVDGMTCNIDG